MASDYEEQPKPERKRGRPKGSKNKTPRLAQGKRRRNPKPPKPPKPPAPPKTTKRGRPPAVVDRDRVLELARQGLPQQYIADLVGVALDTLKKHCSKDLTQGYAEAVEKVNNLTWAAAGENASVLLHLRKVLLGENDKIEIVGDKQEYVLLIDKLEDE